MSKYLDEYVLGEHFVSAARTVTECDVVNFACMTGDMHPNHTDAEVMKHSQFGQRIAHGLLGISWAHVSGQTGSDHGQCHRVSGN